MFDFGNANEAQKEAIQSVNGPVLITARPGTGKTFTLVQRAVYMKVIANNLYINKGIFLDESCSLRQSIID